MAITDSTQHSDQQDAVYQGIRLHERCVLEYVLLWLAANGIELKIFIGGINFNNFRQPPDGHFLPILRLPFFSIDSYLH